jgi:hypothetical protein
MMANASTDKQAEAMTVHWLTNKTRFCINENYETENEGRCYWGLPSISADDPTFPPLGYWRGYVWGPMAQLTYWSLAEYDHVPVVRSARKAMCKQMTAMFLNQWRLHAHICENFVRPSSTYSSCVPGYAHMAANGHYPALQSCTAYSCTYTYTAHSIVD